MIGRTARLLLPTGVGRALPLSALPLILVALLAATSRAHAVDVRPGQEFRAAASWQAPAAALVRTRTLAWVAERQPEPVLQAQVDALWPQPDPALAAQQNGEAQPAGAGPAPVAPTPEDLLNRVAATFGIVAADAKALVDLCRRPRDRVVLPEFGFLTDDVTPAWERYNLRLIYGRWLAHERLYDESFAQLNGLQPDDVVDPAALLFYQGLVQHHLLQKDPAAATLQRLLERSDELPRRYASLAKLMLADMKDLEDDSLDHIARRMQDVERRLDLGRAGPKVREVEDGVIKSLDKLIEEIEKQQQAAAAAASASGAMRPSQPAQDSRILEGKGPGQVDRKALGTKAGWGDLPPKQRQEALQQIGKDYPAHYRDVIEQYFRKLASDDEPAER